MMTDINSGQFVRESFSQNVSFLITIYVIIHISETQIIKEIVLASFTQTNILHPKKFFQRMGSGD